MTDADAVTTDQAVHELFILRTAGTPCQLDGWPTVTLLDSAGKALPVAVRHGGFGLDTTSPRAVTLSSDTSLSFFVATGRSGSCVPASTLRVTLPGTSIPLSATTSMSVCNSAAGVSPVQRLADAD
jgi:hypothetical protein